MTEKRENCESSENTYTSSFPGLWKYTARRDIPFLDAFEWLEAKRKDDGIDKNLWRVHDKLYDLKPFIHRHPGGSEWIELTIGTDITEAFESSHVVNVETVEKILDKYFVKDCTTRRNSPYTFNEDGFYKTLKRNIAPVIQKVGTGPSKSTLLMQDSLGVLFILVSLLGVKLESIPILIVAGTFLSMCITTAHNFFHIKDNWRKYYFDLSIQSSTEWRISHSLSHHMYPNTLLDMEITVAENLLPFLPRTSKNWFERFGSSVYSHFLYFGGFFPSFSKRLVLTFILRKYPVRPEIFIPLAELAIFTYVAPSFWSAFKSWLLVHAVCSYIFIFVGFLAGHHVDTAFHDGDEVIETDWGLSQLDSTFDKIPDIKDDSSVISNMLTLASFGQHPLHHLFPCISHDKLHYIKPIMETTLQTFGFAEKHPSLSKLERFVGLSKLYARNKPNKLAYRMSSKDSAQSQSIKVPQG